jgi:DNA-binding transcriptional regulator LsrR (DeoR family)
MLTKTSILLIFKNRGDTMKQFEFNKTAFAQRIEERLGQMGLSQNQLAEALAISRSTVTGWLRYGKLPDAQILAQLCYVLDCPADWLLGMERRTEKSDPTGKIRWHEALPPYLRGFQREQVEQGMQLFNRLVGNEERGEGVITDHNLQYLQFAIQAALRSGAIRINHVERASRHEEALKARYPNLKQVLVADIPERYDGTVLRVEMVAWLAMQQILSRVVRETVIGLGTGYTILRMCELSIPSVDQFKGTHWLPLTTFTDDNLSGYTPNALAKLMQLRHPGSRALHLPHPSTIGNSEALEAEFQEVKDMMQTMQTLFLTVGGVGRRDRTSGAHPLTDFRTADYSYDSAYLRDLYAQIENKAAFGAEILSYLLDSEGHIIGWDKERVWQISLDILRYNSDMIGKVCIVAARQYKADAVETCIRHGLANVLAIDTEIAEALLS